MQAPTGVHDEHDIDANSNKQHDNQKTLKQCSQSLNSIQKYNFMAPKIRFKGIRKALKC